MINHIYNKNDTTKLIFLFSFSSKGIHSTPQHTDSHPCTQLPIEDLGNPGTNPDLGSGGLGDNFYCKFQGKRDPTTP